MFFGGPLSILLMGVAYLYTFIIKLFFLPLTLVKRIIFPSAGYGRYGQNFGLITIGKILTVLVMFFLLFKKEVFGGVPYQWRQIIGGVSIGIACLSLFVTAQGFIKVFAQAAFWMVSIYLLSDGFFPGFLNSIKGKGVWSPFNQNTFGSQTNYKIPDLMTDSDSLSPRSKGPLPDEAYFPPQKKKLNRIAETSRKALVK